MTERLEGANKLYTTDNADLSAAVHAAAARRRREQNSTPISFNGEETKVEVAKGDVVFGTKEVYTNPVKYPFNDQAIDDYGAPEPKFRKQ